MWDVEETAEEPAMGKQEDKFLKATKIMKSPASEEGLKSKIRLQSGDVSLGLESYIIGKKSLSSSSILRLCVSGWYLPWPL